MPLAFDLAQHGAEVLIRLRGGIDEKVEQALLHAWRVASASTELGLLLALLVEVAGAGQPEQFRHLLRLRGQEKARTDCVRLLRIRMYPSYVGSS